MGLDDRDPACGAAAAALRYLEETQFSKALHVTQLIPLLPEEYMILDRNTVSNLELTEPSDISLFAVLNRCRTAMGKRMLKEWILSPLRDIDLINKRADAIEELVTDASFRNTLALDKIKSQEEAVVALSLIHISEPTRPD